MSEDGVVLAGMVLPSSLSRLCFLATGSFSPVSSRVTPTHPTAALGMQLHVYCNSSTTPGLTLGKERKPNAYDTGPRGSQKIKLFLV